MRVAIKCKSCWLIAAVSLFAGLAFGQSAKRVQSDKAANAQMQRLADALAGDWNTTETMERSVLFPAGGGRHGASHVELAAGGTTLVARGNSNGSAGPLSYMIAIWWDNSAKVYRFFTCFNDPNDPCVVRGTAHWEGNAFVNEYEDMLNGKKMKLRDTFFDIKRDSHRLVEAVDVGNGTMKPLITTMSVRKREGRSH